MLGMTVPMPNVHFRQVVNIKWSSFSIQSYFDFVNYVEALAEWFHFYLFKRYRVNKIEPFIFDDKTFMIYVCVGGRYKTKSNYLTPITIIIS